MIILFLFFFLIIFSSMIYSIRRGYIVCFSINFNSVPCLLHRDATSHTLLLSVSSHSYTFCNFQSDSPPLFSNFPQTHQNLFMSLELLTLSGFEGPEKVIEINLVPNIGPENNQGLRNLTEAEWTTILSAAHCNILCKKSNEYILSICCC